MHLFGNQGRTARKAGRDDLHCRYCNDNRYGLAFGRQICATGSRHLYSRSGNIVRICDVSATCRKVLDDMDLLDAGYSSFVTYSNNDNTGTASPSLFCNSRILGLSDVDRFDRRDLPPPATPSAIRGRQILERLFILAKIDNASAVAGGIIAEFGSIGGALHAQSRITESNPARAILSLVHEAMLVSFKDEMLDRISLSKAADVIEYLVVAMARLPIEEVRVLFLDSKNRLISDEVVSRGTISEAPIYPREILKRSLALDATALILAHNHPSGDPKPSENDIDATLRLVKAGKELGLTVHDHIIVGREGWISLRDWVEFE